MKQQYYFKNSDSETCKTADYFESYMKQNNLTEIEVFKAEHEIIGGGIFWCKKYLLCGDGTAYTCGKANCKDYEPRNGISGVCKHHTPWLYTRGDKITLRL